MSKQSEAKLAQGYQTKPSNCGNCVHRRFDMDLPRWMAEENERRPGTWGDEHKAMKRQRCGIGGFAIALTASCRKHEAA
jgi:hypothetical protein